MRGSLFISYRHSDDSNALAQIERVLVDAFGPAHVFLDKESLKGGDTWKARIHETLRTAPAVVVLYSRNWRGSQADGSARIDDPEDWVRKELVMAHEHRRPLLPVVIDGAPPPKESELPPALRFLAGAQFVPFDPRRPEGVVAALRRIVYGRRWWQRFFAHAIWIALGLLGLVLATYPLMVGTVFDNAFARGAGALREALGWLGSSDEIAVVEVVDGEFREMFGARMPLDGEVLAIGLDRLRKASREAGNCLHNRPVAITLDLMPPPDDHDERARRALDDALVAMAACRPLVLACPQQVETRSGNDAEAWMRALRQRVGAQDTLVFAGTRVDPEGLRYREHPVELALVAAAIADLPRGDRRRYDPWPCACPAGRGTAAACESIVNGWNRRAVGVRMDGSGTWTLGSALTNIDQIAKRRVVMIGTNVGAELPPLDRGGVERMKPPPSTTVKHRHLLHGALHHAPAAFHPAMLAALFAAAWLVATVTMAGGALLERFSDRLLGRVKGYAVILVAMATSVLAPLLLAARWPAWTWLAMPLAVLLVATFSRALLANFELVLRGQPGWNSPRVLWDDLFTSTHKGSAATRLVVLGLEALMIAVCWVIAFLVIVHEGAFG